MLFLLRSSERGKEPHPSKSKQRHDVAACLLAEVPDARLTFDVGRILVEVDRDIGDVLRRLHGVSSFSPCTACDVEALAEHVTERAREALAKGGSFRVKVRRRGDGAHDDGSHGSGPHDDGAHGGGPHGSNELAAELGARILAEVPGTRVDLRAPDVLVSVEIRDRACFVSTEVIPGIDARSDGDAPAIDVAAEPRFLVDAMLGTLASRLRALGYDTVWRRDTADSLLLREARAERRMLLTQDRELSEIGGKSAYFVNAKAAPEQLREVLDRFGLVPDEARIFTRCSVCNAPLERAEKAEVAGAVPPKAFARYDEFWRCSACEKIYWKGSHYDEVLETLGVRRGT